MDTEIRERPTDTNASANAGDERLLMRPREVATMLNLAKSTVYNLIACGEIPSIRVGKAIRVRREAVEQWIREQEERTRVA